MCVTLFFLFLLLPRFLLTFSLVLHFCFNFMFQDSKYSLSFSSFKFDFVWSILIIVPYSSCCTSFQRFGGISVLINKMKNGRLRKLYLTIIRCYLVHACITERICIIVIDIVTVCYRGTKLRTKRTTDVSFLPALHIKFIIFLSPLTVQLSTSLIANPFDGVFVSVLRPR